MKISRVNVVTGSQIIDMMLLVIDITKGIQTQTAEVWDSFTDFMFILFIWIEQTWVFGCFTIILQCLVIGEILAVDMVVVLNKIDLLPLQGRDDKIEKVFVVLTVYLYALCNVFHVVIFSLLWKYIVSVVFPD